MLLSEVNTMMIQPNEDVLVLAERWLKLLSDLGPGSGHTLRLPRCPQLLFYVVRPAQP